MGWKTSSCILRRHGGLVVMLCICGTSGTGHAQPGQDGQFRCTSNAKPQRVLNYSAIFDEIEDFEANCGRGSSSTSFVSDFRFELDVPIGNTAETGMPRFIITYDRCTHLNQPILCPVGVPAGSNSLFFDASSNIVFPGTGQSQVTVTPGNIFPYVQPSSRDGVVNGNSVTWQGVPILTPLGPNRVFRITNVRANVIALSRSNPTSHLPIFASISATSSDISFTLPTSLMPGTSKLLVGIAMPSTTTSDGFCESPLIIGNGITPFALVRQGSVGGTSYDAILSLNSTLTTMDLFAYSASTTSSCRGSSIFNPVNGALDLQRITFQGNTYWGQADRSSSGNFINLRYGTGTMPAR